MKKKNKPSRSAAEERRAEGFMAALARGSRELERERVCLEERGESGRALEANLMKRSKGVSADGAKVFQKPGPSPPRKGRKRPITEEPGSLLTTCQLRPGYRGSPARSQRAERARRNPAIKRTC